MNLEQVVILLNTFANNECLLYSAPTGENFTCYWQDCPYEAGTVELLVHTDLLEDTAYLLHHNMVVSNIVPEGISVFNNEGGRGSGEDWRGTQLWADSVEDIGELNLGHGTWHRATLEIIYLDENVPDEQVRFLVD